MALAQTVVGPLSDRFGRRPVLLAGLALFVLSSLAAPFAPTVGVLIGVRVLQGATGCVGMVVARAIIRDVYERREAATALAYVTMGLSVAPMLAPSLGGVLQDAFDWRAVFLFLAGLGALSLLISWTLIAETNRHCSDRISFGTLAHGFSQLLRMPEFLLFSGALSLSSGTFFAFVGGAPYVSVQLLGLSPTVYGLWFGAVAVGYLGGSFASAKVTERLGVPRMVLVGSILAISFAAIWPALFLSGFGGASALFLPMAMIAAANGFIHPSAIAGAISVRPEMAGAASGLSGAAQIGAGAAFSAASGAVLAGQTTPYPMLILMLATACCGLLVAIAIVRRHRRGQER